MSARNSRKSHAAWTLSIFLMPVLYVLSVPPLALCFPHSTNLIPVYMIPYVYLRNHTPLERMLDKYGGWWMERFS